MQMKKFDELLNRVVGVPYRNDFQLRHVAILGHVLIGSVLADYRGDQLIAVVLIRLT